MPEAVIVATARSPIGRAVKGSLASIRPDDLAAQMVRAALDKVPALDPHDIDDLMLGCGHARRRAGLQHGAGSSPSQLGYDDLPGHDDHPLLLVVVADHPDGVPRDQGRRGRRVHLGRRRDRLPLRSRQLRRLAGHATTRSSTRPSSAQRRSPKPAPTEWHDPRADGLLPDVYIAMGQTAENLALLKDVSREDMDEFGVRSQNLAEKAIANGFWAREITPVTLPDGTVVSQGRRPARRASPTRPSPGSSRCSAPTAGSPPATAARSTTAPPRWSS